jgi:hypothetical protein
MAYVLSLTQVTSPGNGPPGKIAKVSPEPIPLPRHEPGDDPCHCKSILADETLADLSGHNTYAAEGYQRRICLSSTNLYACWRQRTAAVPMACTAM